MTGLLASEVRKLVSVRTVWILSIVGWLLCALGAGVPFLAGEMMGAEFAGEPDQVGGAVDSALSQTSLFVLVVGLLVATTEFRHGTIGRTLLVTPSRIRVLVAKLVVGVGYAVAFVVGCLPVIALVLLVGAGVSGTGLSLGAPVWEGLRDGLGALVLTALFGVAVGAALRNQVVAITVTLAWYFVAESVATFLVPEVARWLPFTAMQSVMTPAGVDTGPLTPLEPLTGLVVFVAYVLAALLVAWALMTRRDV